MKTKELIIIISIALTATLAIFFGVAHYAHWVYFDLWAVYFDFWNWLY